jgi:hypothetical protein
MFFRGFFTIFIYHPDKSMNKIKYILLFLILSILPKRDFAQNLVPNYSFEDTLSCDIPQIYNSPPWFNPTGQSPDYYNPFEIASFARVPYNFLVTSQQEQDMLMPDYRQEVIQVLLISVSISKFL